MTAANKYAPAPTNCSSSNSSSIATPRANVIPFSEMRRANSRLWLNPEMPAICFCKWEKLAYYLARNDSLNLQAGDTLRYNTDSIRNWLAEKKYRRINVKNELPLFITYFSCEGKDGRIKFYDDIYGEDKDMREKYFSTK